MKDFFRKWLGLYKANDLQEFTALRTFYTIAGIAVFTLTSLLILRLITQDYDEAIFFLAGLVVIFFLVLLARRGLYQWSSWLFSLFIFAIITLRALDLQIFDDYFNDPVGVGHCAQIVVQVAGSDLRQTCLCI